MAELFTLSDKNRAEQVSILQSNLVDLIDLSLAGKQAHWNLLGEGFIAVHEQLDAIIDEARARGDEIAERIAALGHPADGRAETVSDKSRIGRLEPGFLTVEKSVRGVAALLGATIEGLRAGLPRLGELDPITEDLIIGTVGSLEKHHWMLRSNIASPDAPGS
ncbi:MAG: Dps family protein [Phycisphaerales bacterium]